MAKRKKKYPPPKPMSDEIRARFQALIDEGKDVAPSKKKSSVIAPKGQLWRWDTLEDVDFDSPP